jgi:hypothetical protein
MNDATEQLLQSASMQQYLTFGHPNLPQITTPVPVGQVAPPAGVPLPGLVTAPVGVPAPVAAVAAAPVAASATPILVSLPAPGGASSLKGGTVTIGKSAGFYVGDEGYVIASAVGVGASAVVTVTDGAGKSVPAQVVRRADQVGLALLKLAEAPTAPLPILPHQCDRRRRRRHRQRRQGAGQARRQPRRGAGARCERQCRRRGRGWWILPADRRRVPRADAGHHSDRAVTRARGLAAMPSSGQAPLPPSRKLR